ncbi:MAG TPA: hypothetical protein VJA20_00320 [Candidatus Nanoarchaeia archaeon]|nr:hypothetical protein [Candidatus Nanoarchaeia archaeon]
MTFALLMVGILWILYQSLKKVIFYKDVRLFFYYPVYTIITFIGMIIGFLKPEYNPKT